MNNNLTLILLDGTELSIDSFGYPCHVVMQCADHDEMHGVWAKLTDVNLRRIEIAQGEEKLAAYNDCFLHGQQSVTNPDGTLTVHWYLDGTRDNLVSDDDREYIEAAKILLGEVE